MPFSLGLAVLHFPMLTEVNKSRLTLNPSVRSLFPVRVLQHFLASVQT